jgi:hypothetical protein
MNPWQGRGKRTLAVALLFAAGGAVRARAAEKLELPEGFPLWQKSAAIQVGLGYKDNVTLSSFDPQASSFAAASVDAALFRLPWNNWQVSLLAMASDTRYWDRSVGVDTEQTAAVSGEFAWFVGKGWKSVSTLQYVFLNQVMDVSATYGVSVPQQVFGHALTVKQGVRKEAGLGWAGLDLWGTRSWFREPLDDSWQVGPQLILGRYYGHGSELSLSYQIAPLAYDTREQTDARGAPIAGTHLRYLPQTVELVWQHGWGEPRRWRNTLRLSYEANRDNAAGYYDYRMYRVGEQLRYRAGRWEVSGVASVAYYDFPQQAVGLDDPRARHRTSVHLGLRGERSLSKHWRVYAFYDHERSLSNLEVEQYEANTVSGGIEVAF